MHLEWFIENTKESQIKIYQFILPGKTLGKFRPIFGGEAHFHSVNTKTKALVTIYFHCNVCFLPFNGNGMCNGEFASKLTENAVIWPYNFSLSDCHFTLIFLEGDLLSGPSLNPDC